MILDNIKYSPTVNGKRRKATTQKIIFKVFFIVLPDYNPKILSNSAFV
jgi:hypothetical protein